MRGVGRIVRHLINLCWFCFKWGLVLLVIGAALAVPYFYHRVDEEIRARVEARFAQQYPDLQIKLRAATLVKGEGIELRGLSVLQPGAEGPGAELVSFEECFLGCPTDWQDLLGAEPEVTRITIRRPILRATRRPDGTWSTARLLPLPKLSKRPLEVRIENGIVEIFDPLKNPSSTLTLRDVNLTLTPPAAPGPAQPAPGGSRLHGSLSGDYFRQVVFEGLLDARQPEFNISGSVERLEISPELRDTLPGPLAEKLAALSTLRGQADLSFRTGYDPAAAAPLTFEVGGRLTRGRIDDPRLPYPLTDIRALVRLSNEGFAIEDMTARSNQAALRMTCRGRGLDRPGTLDLSAEIKDLDLDRRLYDVLPDKLQEQWHKYRPEGRVDADVHVVYDGRTCQPEIVVRCLDVSFANYKFPYRLEHGKGTVQLKDDVLQAHLIAQSGNQAVRLDAQWRQPMSGPCGWAEAKGEELPLDEKLWLAMPERPRAFARSLDLRGTVAFHYRIERQRADEPFHQRLLVQANRCWLRYEHFPYSLSNIRGTLEMADGQWTFRNLEGTNGTGRVLGEGRLTGPPGGTELLLHLRATDIALEEELRDALRPAMRQVWRDLKPRGVVDLVADLRYLERTRQLGLSVTAQPRSESTSIEPTYFPYRLEKVQGLLSYRDGRVTMERFRAEHGLVKVASSGFCDFLPDGGWHFRLEGLAVDRLRVDRELVQAVPARLRKALAELSPTGPISLRGSFDLARAGAPGAPVRSQWNLALGLQQVGVDCGVRLENLNGNMTLAGGFDGRNFHSRGELALDSLTYKDCQFTQVMGPLWIDDQYVLLGAWADRAQSGQAAPARQLRPLSARLFGGTLYGDAWVALGPQPRYALRATLTSAELARCARELMPGRQNLRGRILAGIELGGVGRSRYTLAGRGNIQLREANVYELPLMIAMLKILSSRVPDQNAFNGSDIDFRVQGEHIYFDKINFTGDAISLLGQGEMNFQSDIRLTFTPIVGRGEVSIPVLTDLFTGASQQIMRVNVGGTLHNPDVRKEAFPVANQAIQQFQSDLQRK